MHRFIKWFYNQKFGKKLLQQNMIISLIPVLLLGTFTFYQTQQLLRERETTAISEAIVNEASSLDNRLTSSLEALKLIIWNDGIRAILSKTYTSNYEMYLAYRDVLDPTFKTIPTVNDDIQSITVYTDSNLHPHDDSVRQLSEIKDKSWYNIALNNTSPTFYYDQVSGELLLFAQIYYQYSTYHNIVCLTLDTNNLFGSLKTIFDSPYRIQITHLNDKDRVIYQHNTVAIHSSFLTQSQPLTTVPWSLTLERPLSIVLKNTRQMAYIIIIIILLCLFLVLAAAYYLSRAIVSPLESLANHMKDIESGNFSISIQQYYNDEIGDLLHVFQQMVQRLRYLIDEVLKSKIKQQEFEMKALQAQINPHFLYNSLSMINNKAILAGEESISKMAQLLSTFYRTTLNKGHILIAVKDELTNTLAYANIQRLMHSESFDIIYEAEKEAMDYRIPNLLLQPLVENAILHGIDHKTTQGKGILTIQCYQEENHIVFRVMDNGKGMEVHQLDTILTSSTHGYGVQNVHQRIQLFCGDDYGLSYSSQMNRGTSVTVRIGVPLS